MNSMTAAVRTFKRMNDVLQPQQSIAALIPDHVKISAIRATGVSFVMERHMSQIRNSDQATGPASCRMLVIECPCPPQDNSTRDTNNDDGAYEFKHICLRM